MPENLYHKLLQIDAEILNPDYYQLLELDVEDLSAEQIEAQYKAKMSLLQHNRSTKHKDFIEFLKGQLKAARRILTDAKARQKYDKEIQGEAIAHLRELINLFIQISGNLSEIEETEIIQRGLRLNLPERAIKNLIAKQLKELGFTRVPPSPDQISRAKQILMAKKDSGSLTETGVQSREELLRRIEQDALSSASSMGLPKIGLDSPPAPPKPPTAPLPPLGRAGTSPVASPPSPPSSGTQSISGIMALSSSDALRMPAGRIVRVNDGGKMRFRKVYEDGTEQQILLFLALPKDSPNAELIWAVTRSICVEMGIDHYRTRDDRWEQVLGQIKACDIMLADFAGPLSHPTIPDPIVVTQATIAKYAYHRPVLALTQAPPNKRLPGWTFVHYSDESMVDTSGEGFRGRLLGAIRRELR